MKPNDVLKGVVLVALGAAFYGMLATFVKLAYRAGFTTAEVTTSQFVLGVFGMLLLIILNKIFYKNKGLYLPAKDRKNLILAGTSMGGTSLFYYLSVQYINVSVAIVLLMQSVWISVALDAVITKKMPENRKIFAVGLILPGTVLATNLINQEIALSWTGVFWGFLAAVSFSITMFAANSIATYASPLIKTFWMLSGGAVVVFLFLILSQLGPFYSEFFANLYRQFSHDTSGIRAFDVSIFWRYGWILALFGTLLPPILFNSGFPKTGLGLGSIVSSAELPVSVLMAYFLLNEKVTAIQWLGIVIILFAVVLMNIPKRELFSRKS